MNNTDAQNKAIHAGAKTKALKERFTPEGRRRIQSFGTQHPDFHAAQKESKRMGDSWWKKK